ncbi:cellulase family glycosylhydrolase [Chitinophaga sp. MM2321]|uniref:cellulase family glycosylhydrolase n=1 Tax=Chitinophaga sp. MM2321 TaxID=3137178 RepID=UPI0032D57061
MRQLLFSFCFLSILSLHAQSPYLTTKDRRFIDSTGRTVILHGLNFVNKDKAKGYRYADDSLSLVKMKQWGINCIRLGVTWDGMEPAPGAVSEAYLRQLDERVKWAKQLGMYVLLDMHQDLYSTKYANGAPDWATLDEGKPHYANEVSWDDSYFMSAAVQTAFDNFWLNKPAPDGKGIQDHLVTNWGIIAARYGGEPAVIGFDLLNEPFIGSAVNKVLAAFMHTLAQSMKPAMSEEDVMQQWVTEEGKARLMQQLNDTVLYKQLVAAPEAYYAAFETDHLVPYFQKAKAAIRAVNKQQIIFLEPSVSANFGVKTHIAASFSPAEQQLAFAPHAYDIVTDTRSVAGASNERMKIILHRLDSVSKVMQIPMLLGEWGAFYSADSSMFTAGDYIVAQLEQMRCGEVYWSYFNSLENAAYFPLINRGYPMAVAGELLHFKYDRMHRTLTVHWKNDASISSPTRLYVPFPPEKVHLSDSKNAEVIPDGTNGAVVIVHPIKGKAIRKLVITGK